MQRLPVTKVELQAYNTYNIYVSLVIRGRGYVLLLVNLLSFRSVLCVML